VILFILLCLLPEVPVVFFFFCDTEPNAPVDDLSHNWLNPVHEFLVHLSIHVLVGPEQVVEAAG
jgi:hypothetical protein